MICPICLDELSHFNQCSTKPNHIFVFNHSSDFRVILYGSNFNTGNFMDTYFFIFRSNKVFYNKRGEDVQIFEEQVNYTDCLKFIERVVKLQAFI